MLSAPQVWAACAVSCCSFQPQFGGWFVPSPGLSPAMGLGPGSQHRLEGKALMDVVMLLHGGYSAGLGLGTVSQQGEHLWAVGVGWLGTSGSVLGQWDPPCSCPSPMELLGERALNNLKCTVRTNSKVDLKVQIACPSTAMPFCATDIFTINLDIPTSWLSNSRIFHY